jgi:type III pantothenate kinase
VKTLVLNLGNTSLFAGVFSGDRLLTQFRVPIDAASSERGFSRSVISRLRHRGRLERVAICSVVPVLVPRIIRRVRRHFKLEPQRLTADAPHGFKIGYRRPHELGADRIAAALGARKSFPGQNVIVVDCGTATTVTAVGRRGQLFGGAILPGLALWPAMLAARTAQLPEVELQRPRRALGRSTRESLQSGIFHGHAGAIREVVQRIRREKFGGAPVLVVGTGGHAKKFSREKIFDELVPELVLAGLNEFAQRNGQPRRF